jgi:putative transcriptional regulator
MTITRHLDDATLMSFAAGSLPGALAAVAAAHVAMCARCRREVALLERVGGALLADLPEVTALALPMPPAPQIERPRSVAPAPEGMGEVPAPLARLMGDNLDAIRWRWIAPGLWYRPVPIRGEGSLYLLKGAPGVTVPEHGHGGSELALVLRGTLIDSSGRYGPGDVSDLDEDVEHEPEAGPEGCICIVASEQPARFHSLLARLLQRWHGF